ncbi:Glutamate synthase (ferredoxin) [Beutenbergia cavernae DSM 12333]|uniref:Glutamate synthase (Ferredoxin) n=1 Tax=Beutenbergia cavernae (strain ATCC BAA-8 / DSM 12333 / CCUG 43141 / JCM 11478 / NBRC 16432 / NCIMB 13614 / HKI 0122) TaxID=471853 RepID=C5BV81_BEUC1|nr:glutamate synthase large subunit [Beutenbergia cavernae]ACQ80468.1 Glutamate synthase (ferredoxin) [Beutenbergia cavernae DSM 12333]
MQHERVTAPPATGLYDPAAEHDACGVAFVATLRGTPGRDIVDAGLTALLNLDHRGAVGAEPNSGDGAGILTQIPDAFLRDVVDAELPAAGRYAVGLAFLPADDAAAADVQRRIGEIAAEELLDVLAWRDVPVTSSLVGPTALACMPTFRQLVVADPDRELAGLELDQRAYRLRKRVERELDVYFASLSARTLVYKGMLTTAQLEPFFPDLSDPRYASELALVHSRFSTNTFPSWPLAQPFRMVAHNGEINTVRGNRNWIAAREGTLGSSVLGDLAPLLPVCTPGASDSATFDEVVELLHLAGRSLPHAVLMMIPEAWENHATMDPDVRAFYEYHATLMEPWDGPACLTFTDGELIGAVLDRNGLRPGRYWVTEDGLVVLASEAGVLDIDPATVVSKGRLEPGKMFLVDTGAGRIVPNHEIKASLAAAKPYARWVEENSVYLDQLPEREHVSHSPASVLRRQRTFGYTEEELRILLRPMAATGGEALGAMGTDTPVAVLSQRPRILFDYFTQMFAQVTNPPLDAIREELVTSIAGAIGPEPNLLVDTPLHARKLVLPFPVIDNDQIAKIVRIDRDPELIGVFRSVVVRGTYAVHGGAEALRARLEAIFTQVDRAVANGASFIILSDRDSDAEHAPIPSLLLLSAVHHHLLRRHTRTQVSLVVEAGDVREVHHVALLIGYGAAAVNPYLAMETVEELAQSGYLEVTPATAVANLIKALGKGVLKVMSKMGISTISSYRGAQVFEAVGLSQELVDAYFTGTTSRLDGIGLDVVAAEVAARHADAYPPSGNHQAHTRLDVGGEYQWRRDAEEHLFDPETVFRLQHATRARRFDIFRQYTERVDGQSERLMTLRGLLRFSPDREPVPLDEVEPVSEIVKRFNTGAMSYGSISAEAHETLARAMNALGGRSNTGEGGEDPERLHDPARRSRVKQVASGRFGVTAEYLTHADDIQIKLAQGAKPGEGGQLPGHKVYPWVARTRHSTPGVGLISPPPHHDIYSIEDLAQLIHDLKNANPLARVHVKLVSEFGVGTVAAGVSKAHADVVLISGHDGGTGASPLTSLKHAGTPWEIGLAETQQTLVLNNLRDRIVVQVDGQMKTGRDVVVAALLGAEEYGFATAPMVVSGCIMMRVCHLDTCPVGVATQNPELRARFSGKPEFVVTFFEYIAQEVREHLAALGFRTLEEAIGQVQALDADRAVDHWKARGLDLGPVLERPQPVPGSSLRHTHEQDHGLEAALDRQLIAMSEDALERGEPVRIALGVRNVNRTVGTMLGHEIAKRHGDAGLAADTIDVTLTGSAGQSFGAFIPSGLTLRLYGDANDYVAKGLSGGRIVVRPDRAARFAPADHVIAGNVVAYGATAGEVFLSGLAGERFAVRNSGATLVVEGVGDHGCEYMTGGTVLVLGPTGRNFGAGMSGGVAYVVDLDERRMNSAALATGELLLSPPDADDAERIEALLRRHVEETSSPVGAALLSDLEGTLARVTRVLPAEYARVRDAMARATAEGLDPTSPGVWEQILEVSHG